MDAIFDAQTCHLRESVARLIGSGPTMYNLKTAPIAVAKELKSKIFRSIAPATLCQAPFTCATRG